MQITAPVRSGPAKWRPDFLVHTGGGILGVEVISYGASGGRQVDAAWEELLDHSAKFRERNADLSRFGVRLHFRTYRMPPTQSFEAFCEALAARLRQHGDLARGRAHPARSGEG